MSEPAPRPFSIRIFVPGGDPDGLRLVEKSNWTGVGVVFTRAVFKQAMARPESLRTGVYILVGRTEDSALPTIYVGEGDPVQPRLASHQENKEFWEWAVFFVTKDNSLNKAHVQHLEARLHDLARSANQSNLDNKQAPTPPTLSEAEQADVESFLLDILSICPLLGLGVFEKAEAERRNTDTLLLHVSAKGVKATGYEDARGFVVCRGSQFVEHETPSTHEYLRTLRKDLVSKGVVTPVDGHLQFTQDHVFTSPSTASGVILGRTSNGRDEWKTKDGRSLKQVQASA